jgi:hypothetical protein
MALGHPTFSDAFFIQCLSLFQYKELIQAMKQYPFDMMIFSGDDDSICSLAGTQGTLLRPIIADRSE